MAVVKNVEVLDNNETLTAGAADHTSAVWDLSLTKSGCLHIKHTNGGTGPTVPAQSQIWVSPDNSNWYQWFGPLQSQTTASGIYSWTVSIPKYIKYAKVVSGSNTGQNVTLRVEGVDIEKD